MSYSFVLLIWTFLLVFIAVPVALGLAWWSWRTGRRAGVPSEARALAAGLLPFILIAVGLVWFFADAVYSESIRRVDPGIGDYYMVPVGRGYLFCMIDTTDHGYLAKDGRNGSRAIEDIREFAQVGDTVVGFSGQLGAFVFDTVSGRQRQYSSVAAALAEFSTAPKLETPKEFYESHRFTWQDIAALLVLLSSVVGVSLLWYRKFIRVTAPTSGAV
jgi:hypothetical protein